MNNVEDLKALLPAIDRVFEEACDSLQNTIQYCMGPEETAEWQEKYDEALDTWEAFHTWLRQNSLL